MSHDVLDLSLLLEVLEALACERAVDLQSVDEGGDRYEAVGLDILVELVGSGLVKEDGVLCLVLHCDARKKDTKSANCVHRACRFLGIAFARRKSLTLSLGPLLLLLLGTSRCGSHFDVCSGG